MGWPLAGFGAEPQAGLGGSPKIREKTRENNVVSEQDAKQPAIETGLI